jgi:hypothetical protein
MIKGVGSERARERALAGSRRDEAITAAPRDETADISGAV